MRRPRGIASRELALIDGVEVSATGLGRGPLAPTEDWRGLAVLGELDLAELKVEAAVARGMVRDLCDLHLLCVAGVDLEAAIRSGPTDVVVALKALTDAARFADQPALDLRRAWSVDEAIAYFESEARRIIAGW